MYEHYVPIFIEIHRMNIRSNSLNMYDTCPAANSCYELVRCMYVFMNKSKKKHELSSFEAFIALSSINATDTFIHNGIVLVK